jgi:glycosyltransferase involved in cell wall biosynthesis
MNTDKTSQLPVISIITVVLNAKDDLVKTIESVLRQTYANIEYIVIDGGSTDGTVEIIKQYQNRISYWVSEPDKGISDAFNKGIAAATGQVVGILNAGDRYQPDTIETIAREYQNVQQKNSFLCTGDLYIAEWDTTFKADKNYALKLPFMMPVLNHPACFVAREIYNTIGRFNTDIKIAMDFEFLKRCHKAGIRIQCIDKLLVTIDGFGVSEKRYWRGYAEVLKYSDNKLFTLLLPPYILLNKGILSVRKLLAGTSKKGS